MHRDNSHYTMLSADYSYVWREEGSFMLMIASFSMCSLGSFIIRKGINLIGLECLSLQLVLNLMKWLFFYKNESMVLSDSRSQDVIYTV